MVHSEDAEVDKKRRVGTQRPKAEWARQSHGLTSERTAGCFGLKMQK